MTKNELPRSRAARYPVGKVLSPVHPRQRRGILRQNKPAKLAKNVYLTQKGLSEAREEFDYLKKVKRAEIAGRINQAREFGDLSENAEYDSAIDDQALMESRISELENILKYAKVISNNLTNDFVVIGSTVKIEMDREIDEFTIVGRVEADPAKKRISNESPLGSALLGGTKGEIVEVTTPIVRYQCKILEIK